MQYKKVINILTKERKKEAKKERKILEGVNFFV
jgi:hypothetical protein